MMNHYQQPEYLENGDKVGFVAPAGRINKSLVESAIRQFKDWNYEIVLGKRIYNTYNSFAGTHEERAADLQEMLDNPDIKAIFCIRGGYGTIRIIDKLDFSKFIHNPKWLIGFSDISVLHAYINNHLNIQTIHGPMAYIFKNKTENKQSIEYIRKAIAGEKIHYSFAPVIIERPDNCSGLLSGGNISVMYSLNNTPFDFKTDDKILFLEDIGEYYYHLDRMIMNFKMQGKLENLKALIVGQMTDFKNSTHDFGKNAYEIIQEHVAVYHYPVIYGFPAGHEHPNFPMIFGENWKLVFNRDTIDFSL